VTTHINLWAMVIYVWNERLPADTSRKPYVGCAVCGTPELWRGAAGLCAHIRTCAGVLVLVPPRILTYMYTYTTYIHILIHTYSFSFVAL